MCRFEYLYYQCCPREPEFPCILEKDKPFKIQCQESLDNIYMDPHVPERLEDIPWIPIPGPCCCEGRLTDHRPYAYGPNGDGSIEREDMAVLLQVIRDGKVSAARRKYFPNSQSPAPPITASTVLPAQLSAMQQERPVVNPATYGMVHPQMATQQPVTAQWAPQQYPPGPSQVSHGAGMPAPPLLGGQAGIHMQRGQAPMPWPSTLVGQIRGPYQYGQRPSYPSNDWAGHPVPASLPQRAVTADDAMAWYNSNIFPPIDAPAASARPRQGYPPPRRQPLPARQHPPPVRQQPPHGREPPRLRSPFSVAGPNVPQSQRQPHPQPRGYDPFPAQRYFDLINQTEQRNMRPNMPSVSAPGPSSSTSGPSTSRLDPQASVFVPSSQTEAGTTSATTASEQPATSGDWTRNLGHYVQPQFRNQGTGTPYIQPQWRRQPGAWERGQ